MSRMEEAIRSCAQELRELKEALETLTDRISEAAELWQPSPTATPPESKTSESLVGGTNPVSILPMEDPWGNQERGERIHTDTRQQAIEVGVLVPYSVTVNGKTHDVCFTRELYDALKQSPIRMNFLCKRGLNLLAQSTPEAHERLKRRVVIADDVWVIADPDGMTFLRPEEASSLGGMNFWNSPSCLFPDEGGVKTQTSSNERTQEQAL